jgi:hypothetical protein
LPAERLASPTKSAAYNTAALLVQFICPIYFQKTPMLTSCLKANHCILCSADDSKVLADQIHASSGYLHTPFVIPSAYTEGFSDEALKIKPDPE